MNLFKKALIDPTMPFAEPKTHSFTPVVTDTKNFYQEFMNRIMSLCMTPGWHGCQLDSFNYNQQITLRSVCPHGQGVEVAISHQLMLSASTYGGGIAMADDAFARLVNVCQSMHAHIPPAGQYVYSYAQSQPIGYAPINGPLIKMNDFKDLYAQEYQKMLELQLTSYATSWLTSGITYGQNSGSILSELLKLCPGLATVTRPCPDCKDPTVSNPIALAYLIQHLNDAHMWSREKIAEWLDIISLDDPSVDLTIKPQKETQREQPSIGPGEKKVINGYGEFTLGDDALNTILGIV